ncbi:MAG TPA: hypothetical protein EYN00_06375 [Planctomycetes bacterium]|nr:hypothetical protein [Planctomycetota bacterium]
MQDDRPVTEALNAVVKGALARIERVGDHDAQDRELLEYIEEEIAERGPESWRPRLFESGPAPLLPSDFGIELASAPAGPSGFARQRGEASLLRLWPCADGLLPSSPLRLARRRLYMPPVTASGDPFEVLATRLQAEIPWFTEEVTVAGDLNWLPSSREGALNTLCRLIERVKGMRAMLGVAPVLRLQFPLRPDPPAGHLFAIGEGIERIDGLLEGLARIPGRSALLAGTELQLAVPARLENPEDCQRLLALLRLPLPLLPVPASVRRPAVEAGRLLAGDCRRALRASRERQRFFNRLAGSDIGVPWAEDWLRDRRGGVPAWRLCECQHEEVGRHIVEEPAVATADVVFLARETLVHAQAERELRRRVLRWRRRGSDVDGPRLIDRLGPLLRGLARAPEILRDTDPALSGAGGRSGPECI